MKKKLICETLSSEDHDVMDFIAGEEPNLLDTARQFAKDAHEGQLRKDGKSPYFVHPERVVKVLQKAGVKDEAVLAAAYLHDVLEDTPRTLEGHFPERVISIVKELTRAKEITDRNAYLADFGKKSPEAMLVKLADRYDNLLDGSTTMKPAWIKKYIQGADALLGAAFKVGVNRTGPGARLYGQLAALRDQLAEV